MKLTFDGNPIQTTPGTSLLQLVHQLGMNGTNLADRPLAAKIAGEVFNLNYIPLREKDTLPDRPSMRRAMAASNGEIHLLRYCDAAGREVYARTAQFVIFLAIHRLWPNARARMDCAVGGGQFFAIFDCNNFSVRRLKAEIQNLVEMDIPLIRKRLTTQEAMAHFQSLGQEDKARLLSWRKEDFFDVYTFEDYSNYFYGELAPSTGYLQVWDIQQKAGGFMFIYPDPKDPVLVADYKESPHLFEMFSEGERWGYLMDCQTVADLNELTDSGRIRELIRVNEALHEKNYSRVADLVCQRGARAVMLAGPSSSGKTTSANRLATQLRVHGKKPIYMGLDDYYIDRDKIAPGPDGKLDLEHINTIDTELFGQHLQALLDGEEVEIPVFNFKTGRREWRGHKMKMTRDTVFIIEGLHALNPVLLPPGLDQHMVFKLYVSPLLPLNLDDHNRIPSSYLRLLRRIVRDYEGRGATVERTIGMWDSVRAGEEKWIFPFQENADVIFNSSTLYELAVLKKHIFPLLTAVQPEESCYDEVRAIVKVLNYVQEADVDDEIPPTSLVREFIGGNTFYR
jgi:uridine kinase